MRAPWNSINALLAAVVLSACHSTTKEEGKDIKTLRVYLESPRDLPERTEEAKVGRGADPMIFRVERTALVSENLIKSAELLDEPHGFKVRLVFNSLGANALENYSAASLGKHFLIQTEIDGEQRWLAAPVISRRITDGTLVFTPDADHLEMERLVRGLNKKATENEHFVF